MYPPGDGKGRVGWRTGKRRGPRRFAHDRRGSLCFFEDVSPARKACSIPRSSTQGKGGSRGGRAGRTSARREEVTYMAKEPGKPQPGKPEPGKPQPGKPEPWKPDPGKPQPGPR